MENPKKKPCRQGTVDAFMKKSSYDKGLQKIDEVNLSYVNMRSKIDERFQQMYVEVLELAKSVGSTEK